MRRSFFIVIALFTCCQSNNNSTTEESVNLYDPMVQDEISYISKNIEGLQTDKGKEWYTSDSLFFSYWSKGAHEELKGNYKNAVNFYNQALKIKRYEISTYEVKLSMGRVYLQMNEKQKARQMLLEFKKEAQKDLSGEEVEWGLTDEAKEALSRDIEDCDYLLEMIE